MCERWERGKIRMKVCEDIFIDCVPEGKYTSTFHPYELQYSPGSHPYCSSAF